MIKYHRVYGWVFFHVKKTVIKNPITLEKDQKHFKAIQTYENLEVKKYSNFNRGLPLTVTVTVAPAAVVSLPLINDFE